MTVTWSHLSGTFEATDKVIAYRLETDWNNSNTSSIDPVFENGQDEPDYYAQFDRSGPNKILINTLEGDFTDNTNEVNSDTVHSVREEIIITIVAESKTVRGLFESEVNRILWEASPNSSTRIVKSDAADSHIDHFEKSEVSFRRIELPDNETAYLEGSEGSLYCIYFKFKA